MPTVLTINGDEYAADLLLHSPKGQQMCREAHGVKGTQVRCLCRVGGILMTLRMTENECRPVCGRNLASAHDPACRYYSPRRQDTRGNKPTSDPRVVNGRMNFNIGVFSTGIRRGRVQRLANGDGRAHYRAGVRRSGRHTLGGALTYILEEAGVTAYTPGSAEPVWDYVAASITRALANCRVQHGVALSELTLVPTERNVGFVAREFRRIQQLPDAERVDFRLVIGELESIDRPDIGTLNVRLAQMHQPIRVSTRAWGAAKARSWSKNVTNAMSELGKDVRTSRILYVARVEVRPDGTVVALSSSLLVTSTRYIPVQSAGELRVENGLVEAGIRFTRPIRSQVACAGRSPDFVAWVGERAVMMEVAGLSTCTYLLDLRVKVQVYASRPLLQWCWHVPTEEAMPLFEAQTPESILARIDALLPGGGTRGLAD